MIDLMKRIATRLDPSRDPFDLGEVDPQLVERVLLLVRGLERYFRAEVHGLERMPAGPALLVGNHNAGITFFEPFLLGAAWHRHTGGKDFIHFLGHDAIIGMPGLGNLLIRLGGVRAGHDAAATVFARGGKVAVFPGGDWEAFRPYAERHQVDFHGRTGFVRLALRNAVPIVPVLCLGGHETFLVLRRGTRLAHLLRLDQWLRSEACPIYLGLPWGLAVGPMFHFPLPAKMLVEVGEPISLQGFNPADADDPQQVQALYGRVTGAIQAMMDRRSAERRWPVLG